MSVLRAHMFLNRPMKGNRRNVSLIRLRLSPHVVRAGVECSSAGVEVAVNASVRLSDAGAAFGAPYSSSGPHIRASFQAYLQSVVISQAWAFRQCHRCECTAGISL